MVGKCSTSRPYPSLIFHFNKNGCALQKAQVNEIRMVIVVVTFYHLKGFLSATSYLALIVYSILTFLFYCLLLSVGVVMSILAINTFSDSNITNIFCNSVQYPFTLLILLQLYKDL